MKKALVLSLILFGCISGGTEPEGSLVLPIGTYHYTFHTVRDLQAWDYAGTFAIISASGSHVAGTWNVPEFEAEIQMGDSDEGAYLVWANLDDDGVTGQIRNRIARLGDRFACSVTWWFVFGEEGEDTGTGTCTVTGPS
jgi:hypothetical protein